MFLFLYEAANFHFLPFSVSIWGTNTSILVSILLDFASVVDDDAESCDASEQVFLRLFTFSYKMQAEKSLL